MRPTLRRNYASENIYQRYCIEDLARYIEPKVIEQELFLNLIKF